MTEIVRKMAVMCVARAVMFGSLAIICVMFAFAFNPPAAFRTGAVLALLMAAVLIMKAHYARYQKPRNTEVWLYLDDRTRPRDADDARRFARMMREVYGRFALASFAAACCMFAVSTLLIAAGMEIKGIHAAGF